MSLSLETVTTKNKSGLHDTKMFLMDFTIHKHYSRMPTERTANTSDICHEMFAYQRFRRCRIGYTYLSLTLVCMQAEGGVDLQVPS